MPIFILPYEEFTEGYYEIEAENIEEARKIVEDDNFTLPEPEPTKGELNYFPEDLHEARERN